MCSRRGRSAGLARPPLSILFYRGWPVGSLIGPVGLPADVIARLNKAARAALSDPKLRAKLQAQGTSAEGSTPTQFFDLVKSEYSKWGKLMSNVPKQ